MQNWLAWEGLGTRPHVLLDHAHLMHSHVQSGTILLDADVTAESVDQIQDGMV